MPRPRTAADDKTLRRLLDLVGGDLEELNRWARAVLKQGKQKRGRKHMRDRVSIGMYEQLLQLRGRQRTKAIRQLIRDGRIRGDGEDRSTIARFKRDLRELEKTGEQLAAAFQNAFHVNQNS